MKTPFRLFPAALGALALLSVAALAQEEAPQPGVHPKAGVPGEMPREGWNPEEKAKGAGEGYGAATWGMGLTDVQKAIPDKTFETKGGAYGYKSLFYKDQIAGESAEIEFFFKQNLLYLVVVKFDTQFYQPGDALPKFDKFQTVLTDKYGVPLLVNKSVPDSFLDNPAKAILDGNAAFESRWTTAGSEVTLKLSGQSGGLEEQTGFDFRILYRAKGADGTKKESPESKL